MKCSDTKIYLMDLLYDEINEEDNILLKNHLSDCSTCREEFESLKKTSNVLQQWEDVEPNLNLTFVKESASFWEMLKEKFAFSPKQAAIAFSLGFAFVLLVLSIFNTEISYQNGNFAMKMSLVPRKEELKTAPLTEHQLAQIQQYNIGLINNLITQSETKQQQHLISTLTAFSKEYDSRRSNDLQLVGVGLEQVERNLYTKMQQQINNQHNNLIRMINTQQGGK
jgi:hypothetical protein